MREPTSCDEALRRLAEYLDGELGADEAMTVSTHLQTCRSCYSRAEFEQLLKSRVAELRACEMEPEFELRIRTLISEFVDTNQ